MTTQVDSVSAGNRYLVCQYKGEYYSTFGDFMGESPLDYSVPLILTQISLISITSQIIQFCLRPLKQSSMVALILGGILFGPSVLGQEPAISDILFPTRSIVTLETASKFGAMFFFFAVGVKQDSSLMIRPGKRAAAVAVSAMTGTFVLTLTFAFLLKKCVHMDDSMANALPIFAGSQCMTAFPNIACLLTELKVDSSDLGQIAISAALLCDFIGISLTATLLTILQSFQRPFQSMMMFLTTVLFLLSLVFIVRPIILKVSKKIPRARSLPERYVLLCFVGTLLAGFISEIIGQHYMLGPLVFGLMVPDGQPLGEPIISKLDYPIGKLIYPIFLTTSGLKTNFFEVDPWSLFIGVLLIFVACMSKIISVVIVSLLFGLKLRDAFVLGLMLNAKGICELVLYNLMKDAGVFTDQEFALSVASVIVVTAVIAPLIKWLYDPSSYLAPLKRRTIRHMKRDAELRILVCIKNQESVPSIVNLLEASNASEESYVAVIALLLTELVGRATPMLVAHQTTRMLQPTNSRSGSIINALRQYELNNQDFASLKSFSAVSHMQTTHQDICRLALEQNATIVILPFHKHWEIDGSVGSDNRAVQNMNIQVMNRCPCSLGILVDRGILTGSLSIRNSPEFYRVAVIYIGGPDDAESLSYGSRMGRHNRVTLTIIRFLLFGYDTARERKHDNQIIDEVRHEHRDNQNFIYQEQVVKDGVGLAAFLKGLANCFDLMIVGRSHQASEIIMGLGAWSECPELGIIGDMLASPDFGSTASVLVVQQQRLHGENANNQMMRSAVMSYDTEPAFSRSSNATGMSD